MTQKTNAVALKDQTIDALSTRIKALQRDGEIHFPPDYSPQNALKTAWLIIQNTRDMDKNLALEVCTPASIYNALFDMVITGLNPAKKQGYFIVYGKQLAFQRSYFGAMALAKRVDPDIGDIIAEVVYQGDTLVYEIKKGKRIISEHKQTLESADSKKIKAAYAMIIDKNGEVRTTEIMTWDQIKAAWKKSKMKPVSQDGSIKSGSTHDEFPDRMARRTVINRICTPIINSSDDKNLKISATRAEVIQAEEEAQEGIDEFANQGEIIDLDPEEDQTGEEDGDKDVPCEYPDCPAVLKSERGRKKHVTQQHGGIEYDPEKHGKGEEKPPPEEGPDPDELKQEFLGKIYDLKRENIKIVNRVKIDQGWPEFDQINDPGLYDIILETLKKAIDEDKGKNQGPDF